MKFIARNILDNFQDIPENPNADNILDNFQDVLKNPNTPVDILRKAAQLHIPYIQKLVINNPNTPPDLIQEIDSGEILQKNPNFNPLDIYKIHLEQQIKQETEKFQKLISNRNKNSYTLPRNTYPKPNTQQTPTLQSLPRIYNRYIKLTQNDL